jgi:hypothetical protein
MYVIIVNIIYNYINQMNTLDNIKLKFPTFTHLTI